MAKPPRSSDLTTVLRGFFRIGSAAVDVRTQEVTQAWATSSLRPAVLGGASRIQESLSTVIQQPQALQRNALKSTSEVLARVSMVTEGLKAYSSNSVQPAVDFQETLNGEENPLHDNKIEEVNIEELLMQEVSNGSDLSHLDHASHANFGKVQEEISNIVEKARNTREEVNKRVEFEPLLSITKVEEKEFTNEDLEILDQKIVELEHISHGHSFMVQEKTSNRDVNEVTSTINSNFVQESVKHTDAISASASTNPKELSIENFLMHDVMNSNPDELPFDSQRNLYNKVEATTEAVKKNIDEMENEIKKRVLSFEDLSNIKTIEKPEITVEDLEAIDEKLSNLQNIAYGHDLNIFKEIENPKPVEEAAHEIITNQFSDPKEMTKSQFKTHEQDLQKSLQNNDFEKQSEIISESGHYSKEATIELETSTSQVAKPVTVEDTYASTLSDAKVGAQIEATAEALQIERLATTETESEGTSAFSSFQNSKPTMSNETEGGAAAAAVSSTVAANITAASPTLGTAGTVDASSASVTTTSYAHFESPVKKPESNSFSAKPKPKLLGRKPLAKEKPKSTLAENAQARKVPHSRISRLVSFGGLAAGLGMGTLAEVTRRSLGLRQDKNGGSLLDSSPFLTEANAKRIVDTLCRVRGAALKLGQMLSIQDSALINPQLQKIFERVRQSADFMPTWQLEAAIKNQLGADWRSKVSTFDEKPFAAASIGQVHLATLHDGRSVAMKIQYPGVAEGIESDINNLVSSLKVGNIFPEGLFVDSVIEVAKRELRWECDYVREAECTKRFKEMLKPYPELYVPEVIPELCTPQIITTELIAGIAVDKCTEIDQESRNYISEKVVHVCLMELFQFGFMQTDPNWSNFFYDAETEQVALLDFGACREYKKDFVDKYLNLIHGAALKDRDKVHKYSLELGFLTGYEAKVMVDAHVDAIMILGEAFQEDKPFDFGDQNITHRIQTLVPVMISHRMCAPPEEIYSLHRKMSGVFLLCTKLNAVVNCHNLFHEIYRNYKFGGTWEDFHAGKL